MNLCYRDIHYEPALGQFLTADPHPGKLDSSLSVINRFTYTLNNPISLVDPSGASVFGELKMFSKKMGDIFGKVGSVIFHNVILGPIGTLTSINFSGQFSEKDIRMYNFAAAIVFNIALGPEVALVNVGLSLSEPGNFVDNFTNESGGTLFTEGLKGIIPFFKELVSETPIKVAYVLYRFDKNDSTINRRTDRVCRWFTFNKCPL